MSLFYQIKSKAVLKILNDNLKIRENGVKKVLAFAEKEGFEVCSVNDGCYGNIDVCFSKVPEDKKSFFKRNKNGIYTPKLNTKVGKFWAEKIKEFQIKLTNPFPKISEETGYKCTCVFNTLARTLAFSKIVYIGKKFFLIIPKPIAEETKENSVHHPLYESKQRWEIEKLIAEEEAGNEN